jgi:hypothetical protein
MITSNNQSSRSDRLWGFLGLFALGLVGVASVRIAADEAAQRQTIAGRAARGLIACIAALGAVIDELDRRRRADSFVVKRPSPQASSDGVG